MKSFFSLFTVMIILFPSFALAQQPGIGNVSPALLGSVPQGSPTAGTIPLSISDAIDRALRYNLGTVISLQQTRVARASRLRALSELLPQFTGGVTEIVRQNNLAAFGFSGFPGVPAVIGPFSVFDARASVTESLVDFKLLHELREASEKQKASSYSEQDVRDAVVLITTGLYLEAVAANSRVDAARAQLTTAQAVYNRTLDLQRSGIVAGIDVLREKVRLQDQQQRLVAAENESARQKLNLARAIGLPLGQDFSQTDSFVTAPPAPPGLDQALNTALDMRADYLHAAALIRAAEESRKAAAGRGLPSLQVNADYGDIGRAPGASHGTVTFEATLSIPIYTGGRVQAELLESDALLEQRKAEAASLRDRIEYEIRTARLDIQSANERVQVATEARTLAQQQLDQAQDRVAAGVATSLEILQAQEAIATADENYISSLYALNIAHASLARAMGVAEQTIKTFFGGQ